MLRVGPTSLLLDMHFRIFKVYMLLLLWASILVQFQVESTRSKLNSGFPQEVGFNIYFYGKSKGHHGVLFFWHKFCFLETSWSPNSTDLHLDFYMHFNVLSQMQYIRYDNRKQSETKHTIFQGYYWFPVLFRFSDSFELVLVLLSFEHPAPYLGFQLLDGWLCCVYSFISWSISSVI